MKHDVFISFSSVNTDVAKKICAALEESGEISCWIAYRDIVPSANYAEQLVEAIESCKLLLLILSDESNKSPQVSREIERAGSKGIPILPLRIEDVVLSKSMEYFISSHHWLDAYESDIEDYFPALKAAVESSIRDKTNQDSGTDASTRKGTRRPVSKKGIQPQHIFGAGLALTLLIMAFLFLKPHLKTSQVTDTSPPPVSHQNATGSTTVSPQDALIQELAQRYKENRMTTPSHSDDWTSSNQLSIAFLDISGFGINDAERDFILNKTSEDLRMTKRYSIVEREIIDKLLEELNLSTSALTDPATALKLGRILSANLIVTGSLSHQGEQWLANLRFIETETTAIKCSVSALIEKGGAEMVASELSEAINSKLRIEFPLQAKVTSVSGKTVEINIGELSGVSAGMTFILLQENNMPIDVFTITAAEQQQSYIALTAGSPPVVKEGMRLREKIQE